MAEENKIRDAADAVKGIVEAVPVYQDAIQPAAKEIGTALQTVAKSIHVALAPISGFVWGYEKIKDYLNETLAEKLKNVPVERIVTPTPAVAGPTVESLRFTAHEPSLRELYANLLATSMDAQTAQNAHPAFVEIIRQLTPDEARLMQVLAQTGVAPMITYGRRYNILNYDNYVDTEIFRHFSLLPHQAHCLYPDSFPSYLNNLCRLGLVEIKENYFIAGEGLYEPLENHSEIKSFISADSLHGLGQPAIRREALFVTDLGRQFCTACVIEDSHA